MIYLFFVCFVVFCNINLCGFGDREIDKEEAKENAIDMMREINWTKQPSMVLFSMCPAT
jgi:hypothetical protein